MRLVGGSTINAPTWMKPNFGECEAQVCFSAGVSNVTASDGQASAGSDSRSVDGADHGALELAQDQKALVKVNHDFLVGLLVR